MIRRHVVATFLAATLGVSGLTLGTVATQAAAGGPTAKTFVMRGSVISANSTTHRFVVLSGTTRYTIYTTTQTRYTLNARATNFFAIRAGQTVTTTGLFRAQYRVALRVMLRSVTTTTLPSTPATATLTSVLNQALTQEKYALATYQNVIAKIGSVAPFSRILPSEQQHVSTISALMTAHGVTVPSTTVAGAASPTTLTGACQLGVTVETTVIAMYQKNLTLVKAYPDVVLAFTHLLDASQYGHLPAFLRCS